MNRKFLYSACLVGALALSPIVACGESPVAVAAGRDIAWGCRETATGCIVDFTNKPGFNCTATRKEIVRRILEISKRK